jgi:hypothetical protein
MMTSKIQLAQANVSYLKFEIDHPCLISFGLGASIVKRTAAMCDGHIWSQQSYEGGTIFLSRSVWTSLSALNAFVYSGPHKMYMKRAAEWFKPMDAPNMALWWVSQGEVPTVEKSLEKLDSLKTHGANEEVFDFGYLQRSTGRP